MKKNVLEVDYGLVKMRYKINQPSFQVYNLDWSWPWDDCTPGGLEEKGQAF
jgi:hypothetical protein